MKKNIELSIIIPVYNAEDYLEECLESVVNQDISNYEIICVNDGSTDNSLDILNKYHKKYSNIKVINQKNGGVISARISGYEAANGKYIAWVDADDFVSKNMFKKMMSVAKNENADLVYCNYEFYPNKVINKQKWYNSYKGIVDWKLILNNTVQWNKIVKKEILDFLDIRTLFETIGEGCYGLVFINAEKIVSLDESLYFYRVGHTSLSSNFNNIEWYKKVVERSKNMMEYVIEKNYDEEWKEYYKYRYLYYHLMLMIVASYVNDKKTYEKSKIIINKENLFSKKYYQYIRKSFSMTKYIFLKFLGIKSYILMRLATKVILNNG